MVTRVLKRSRLIRRWCRASQMIACAGAISLGLGGCGVFNPAFVDLLGSDVGAQFSTIDSPPGHVIVSFINNVEFDDRLINYLIDQGVAISSEDRRSIKPLIRMRVRVTFVDRDPTTGEQVTADFEFSSGSTEIVDPAFAQETKADRERAGLQNAVLLCDVAKVEILPLSSLEVFIPVEILEYELVNVTGAGGTQATDFEIRGRRDPRFRQLRLDDADDVEDGLQRNIDQRDFSSQAPFVVCGNAVSFVVSGSLSVPFLTGTDDNPSFDRADVNTEARIGGRYQIRVSVQ